MAKQTTVRLPQYLPEETFEEPGFKQDGFDFRALQVWPGVEP